MPLVCADIERLVALRGRCQVPVCEIADVIDVSGLAGILPDILVRILPGCAETARQEDGQYGKKSHMHRNNQLLVFETNSRVKAICLSQNALKSGQL